MVKVNRQTYAGFYTINLSQYETVHGIIESFGGKVKQFTQDLENNKQWHIFFEMAKLQRVEFEAEILEFVRH